MDIGTKITEARKHAGFTQEELASKVGVTGRSIRNYETDARNISVELLFKIADICKVDFSYFVTMSKSLSNTNMSLSKSLSVTKSSPSRQVVNEIQQTNTVKVNYYPNILASAGFGVLNHDVNIKVLELEEGFLMALGLKCFKNLDLITVYGDSMEPFVSNGELIILQRDVEAQNSDIVVANINGEIYVKKLQRDPIKKWIKLTSLNAMYPDIELKEDELKYLSIVGIVRAKIRPF